MNITIYVKDDSGQIVLNDMASYSYQDGVLLVNKAAGFSSFPMVNVIRVDADSAPE